MKIARLLSGVLIAALFLWLLLRQVDIRAVAHAFAGTGAGWIGMAMVFFALGYAARIERWRIMLAGLNPDIRWRQSAGPLMAGFAVNNILPFRAGDILRVFAFQHEIGVPPGPVMATLLVERILDFLTLLILLGGAIVIFGPDLSLVAGLGGGVIAVLVLIAIAILACPGVVLRPFLGAARAVARVFPGPGGRLTEEIHRVSEALGIISRGRSMALLAAWSGVAWLAEGLVFYAAARALPALTAPLAAWIALPVGTLSTLIPGTPGYVGTFDFFAARAMISGGNDTVAATAFAFLIHVILWLPPTLAGGGWLLMRHVGGTIRKGDRQI